MTVLTHVGASVTLFGLGALPIALGIGSFADPAFPFAQAAAIAGLGFAAAAATEHLGRMFRARRPALDVLHATRDPVVPLVLETMIRVIQADGKVRADETRLVRDSIYGLTEVKLDEEDIVSEMQGLRGSNVGFLGALGDRRYDLTDSAREIVIKAAYLAMMADGRISDEEGWFVDRVYAALMPHRKLEAIISDLDPWLR